MIPLPYTSHLVTAGKIGGGRHHSTLPSTSSAADSGQSLPVPPVRRPHTGLGRQRTGLGAGETGRPYQLIGCRHRRTRRPVPATKTQRRRPKTARRPINGPQSRPASRTNSRRCWTTRLPLRASVPDVYPTATQRGCSALPPETAACQRCTYSLMVQRYASAVRNDTDRAKQVTSYQSTYSVWWRGDVAQRPS